MKIRRSFLGSIGTVHIQSHEEADTVSADFLAVDLPDVMELHLHQAEPEKKESAVFPGS